MHTIAAGEPPLSPETVGRAPSNFDAPVPVVPFDELVRRKSETQTTPGPGPITATERHRLVVRMTDGDQLGAGSYVARDEAATRAKELVVRLAAAEAAGEWPEIDGRHLRPASIVSVDVVSG